ncbi:MAG: nitrate reductase molybdenum cofactor assembly chaperone [Planctomycetota bacterium]
MPEEAAFEGLAVLLEYPETGFQERVPELVATITAFDSSLSKRLAAFADPVVAMSSSDLEELYTRTFDINPLCSLEVGWQVYGETYDRGGFLVNVNMALRDYGIPPSKELADHLPQMLRLFTRSDPKKARDLSVGFLKPAIERMLTGFTDESNPYGSLLSCVQDAIENVVTAAAPTDECHVE